MQDEDFLSLGPLENQEAQETVGADFVPPAVVENVDPVLPAIVEDVDFLSLDPLENQDATETVGADFVLPAIVEDENFLSLDPLENQEAQETVGADFVPPAIVEDENFIPPTIVVNADATPAIIMQNTEGPYARSQEVPAQKELIANENSAEVIEEFMARPVRKLTGLIWNRQYIKYGKAN